MFDYFGTLTGQEVGQPGQVKMQAALNSLTSGDQARGLQNFITEIRNCTNREQEQQRIDKELANIRQKFSNSSSLTPYQRKK